MSGHESGEYGLADLPEPPRPKAPPPTSSQPLPRLWKTEPEYEDEEAGAKPGQKTARDGANNPPAAKAAPPGGGARPRGSTSPARAKSKSDVKDGDRGKALVEETPAFDTYEARQRGRLIVGGLFTSIFLIFGWIGYRLFLYDPGAVEASADDSDPVASFGPAQPKRDLDGEARAMFNRAQDSARAGRTEQAVTLLENIAKVYKGTKTAAEAKDALARPGQNLPLFLDRPAVTAEPAPPPAPEAPPEPPQVVVAQLPLPAGGNASLTLPANPAEPTPGLLSPPAMANSPDLTVKVPVKPRPLPPGFTPKAEAGVHSSGWPLAIVGDRDGATMVLVPGGVFIMGSDDGPAPEGPSHKVRLSPYYIDQHEVTAGQFRLFLKETRFRGQPPHSWSDDFRKDPSDSIPMVMVNARDAQAYADWAQKRLPTEAQWEMAARSTDGRLFPSGPDPISYSRPRAARQIDPVKSFPEDVSPYGVFDMAGNVLEWTGDWYDAKAYRQILNQPVDNPTGPAARPRSNQLAIKGGAKNGSAAHREGMALDKRLSYVGFRCVLPVFDGPAMPLSPGAPLAPAQPQAPSPGGTEPVPAQPF